jgi:hypothetical protein
MSLFRTIGTKIENIKFIKNFKIYYGNWVCSLIKMVLRNFYIEYFSTFAGDFAPIAVYALRNVVVSKTVWC